MRSVIVKQREFIDNVKLYCVTTTVTAVAVGAKESFADLFAKSSKNFCIKMIKLK